MERIKENYPQAWQSLSAALETVNAQERQNLLLLYAHLDCHDIPSVSTETMLSYVRATLRAGQLLSYTRQVPEELYAPYVLNPRVNNEWLDGSREWLLEKLYPRVKDLGMMAAALEVNYWCYEQATYRSTDDRTIGPFGICRRGYGRCGEESTLLVCALRAVGIPARQVYAPYWAHCDDNHAWVEFWAEGGWHYMGACEPEYVPDQGWFQSAASRAMLIRSRVPDGEGKCRVENSTGRYAKTANLRVCVTNRGKAVAGAEVRFQLVNYSRIQTLHTAKTDENGIAELETGLGSLLVSSCVDGIYAEKLVTLPAVEVMQLRLEEGFDPQTAETEVRYTLHAPREMIPAPLPENTAHQLRLDQCDALRQEKISRFTAEESQWLAKARGNRAEIEAFLALDAYSAEDKELLLETLSEKDFCDCTCDALESFLMAALPWKAQYPLTIWQREILAPRVENEQLLNIRPRLQALLAGYDLSAKEQVLDWMEASLRRLPEYGLTDRRGNAAGYVANRCCPESEWDILAVQICRALGIPAALSGQTRKLEGTRENRRFALKLKAQGQSMTEEESFSLSRWNGKAYVPIHLNGCVVREETTLSLEPGAYCLLTSRRQIDGSVNVMIHRFPLHGDRECTLCTHPDRTKEKLISVQLPQFPTHPLAGNTVEVLNLCRNRPSLLIFLEPGKEPTEHLLREMLSLWEEYSQKRIPIRFLLRKAAALNNPTLQAVLEKLPDSAVWLYEETAHYALQCAAGIGDARLPFAIALDRWQRIVYGCANYNIRTAATLLHVLSLLDV